ncbi:MAG TPA: hypothetical protein EYN66_08075 [Myxococcales bacterium]|nr:hypothetical protein [Myxococcales bacterium]
MPEYSPEELELMGYIDDVAGVPLRGPANYVWHHGSGDYFEIGEAQTRAIRALRLTGWNTGFTGLIPRITTVHSDDDMLRLGGHRLDVAPFSGFDRSPINGEHWLLQRMWGIPNFGLRYIDTRFYWKVAAILTFSLRRPIKGVTEPEDPMQAGLPEEIQWGMMVDNLEVVQLWWENYSKPDELWYAYYDGEKEYSHAFYLDPTQMVGLNGVILRLNGTKTSQQVSGAVAEDLTIEITPPRHIPIFPHWDDDIIEKFHRSTDPEMQEYTKALDDWSALMNNAISQLA